MASQITIAFVAASLDILGGQGVQADLLMNALRGDGYQVAFVPVNQPFPQPLRWARRWPCIRTLINELIYIPKLLALRDADLIQIFSASYWSFLLGPAPAMLVSRLFGKRIILNYHSGEADDHLHNWGSLVHPFMRLADDIVVPSEYLRQVFRAHGYSAQVIPNTIDLSQFRYRERNPLLPRFLSTRNLEQYYRVDNTLRAFAIVQHRFPSATLTVAGYGSKEATLRRLARELGVHGVSFVGRVAPHLMPSVYDSADIYLNSSELDNQPISLLEAFASGLPVISTPTGDIPNMIRDRESGLLVTPDDPAAMADAATQLLHDPVHTLDMAACARQEVERYTWGKVGQEWARVYSEALS